VKHALAADSLRSLLDCGEASRYVSVYNMSPYTLASDISDKIFLFSPFFPSYDFAFVDADKRMYEEYFELLLKLVRFKLMVLLLGFGKHMRFFNRNFSAFNHHIADFVRSL
jgi:hypothetical protein